MRALPRIVLASILAALAATGFGQAVLAAGSLTVTTPYPAVVVGPGSKVACELTIKTTAEARVDLSLSGVPTGWDATIHGGGFDITAVQTNGKDATTASVDVTVPADASGKSTISVTAKALGETVTLPLDVEVEFNAGAVAVGQSHSSDYRGQAIVSMAITRDITRSLLALLEFFYVTRAQRDEGHHFALNTGLVYRVTPTFTVDAAVQTSLLGQGPDYLVRTGFSARFGP